MTTNTRIVPAKVTQALAGVYHGNTQLMRPAAVKMAWKCLIVSCDAANLNAGSFTSSGGAAPADGNLANGTTHAQSDAIKEAVIKYFMNAQASMADGEQDEDPLIVTTNVRGGANRAINITRSWVLQAFKEGCSDATWNANAWDREKFYLRKLLRWSTPEADTYAQTNGTMTTMCEKYGIPLEFKRMAYDFCYLPFMNAPKPSNYQLSAYNAYYLAATATGPTQKNTSNHSNYNRTRYYNAGHSQYNPGGNNL